MKRVLSSYDFIETLDHIKHVDIHVNDTLAKKGKISVIDEITYSSITKKTNYDQLGDFVVIDTETTGLSALKEEIVEICALRFRNFIPVECFTTLCKPNKPISPSAAEVNGITEDMVCDKPHFRQIVEDLNTFIGKDTIVGQNLPFDLKFIVNQGFDLSDKRKYYDTLPIAKKTLKARKKKYDRNIHMWIYFDDEDYDVENYKLGTLCDYYAIPLVNAHRALADCYATGLLFEALAYYKIFEEK